MTKNDRDDLSFAFMLIAFAISIALLSEGSFKPYGLGFALIAGVIGAWTILRTMTRR